MLSHSEVCAVPKALCETHYYRRGGGKALLYKRAMLSQVERKAPLTEKVWKSITMRAALHESQ